MGWSSQAGSVDGAVPSTLSMVSASRMGVMKPISTIMTVLTMAPRKGQMFALTSSHIQAAGFFRLGCIGQNPP